MSIDPMQMIGAQAVQIEELKQQRQGLLGIINELVVGTLTPEEIEIQENGIKINRVSNGRDDTPQVDEPASLD